VQITTRGSATRDRILDAALALFARDGVSGTPITAIERDAGLAAGSGSLYRHFRSKEEVLEALLVREVARIRERTARPGPTPRMPDGRSQLTLELHRGLDGLTEWNLLIGLLARESDRAAGMALLLVEAMFGHRGDEREPALALDRAPDRATDAVVVADLVGYHLAGRFFGQPLYGVERDQFVEALVGLLVPAD
jgi:AcrR family transcriptional regulator